MVKNVLWTMTMAIASGDDDSTSLLQVFAGVRHSHGQRILDAVAKEGSTICVEAAAGDVAPVAGSYIAKISQEAVEVAAGSVAVQAGSFCVPKQDVLLMQRTFGLNTARDFEAALGAKKKEKQTTTTTTMDFENFNFAENLKKEVMVQQCPDEKAGLLQTMDATVAQKGGDSSPQKQSEADEMRVCECRSFLESSVGKLNTMTLALDAMMAPQLLQRNFDAALVKKQKQEVTTTTTTSTTTTTTEQIDQQSQVKGMTAACTRASELPVKTFGPYGMVDQVQMPSWAIVAKLLNDPDIATMFKAANITEGWQHCDQSWVVHGACGKFLPVSTTTAGGAVTTASAGTATTAGAVTTASAGTATTASTATTAPSTTVENSCSTHDQCGGNEYCNKFNRCFGCNLCPIFKDGILSCPAGVTSCASGLPSCSAKCALR